MQNMDALSRQVYEESKKQGWPGLGEEVTKICSDIRIPDLNSNVVTKEEIKDAIRNHHYIDMKEELSKSKKLSDIKNEDFTKVQSYFNGKSVESTRMAFRIRSHMVPEIPGNFKNKYRNKEGGMTCSYCEEEVVMDQSHCLKCEAWTEMRRDLDLSNIDDLVMFFRNMLKEMASMEDDKRKHCTTPQ